MAQNTLAAVDCTQDPWSEQDIGNTGTIGSAACNDGTFTVSGAGEDAWDDSADAVHFAYRAWTGDCALIPGVQNQTYSVTLSPVMAR